MKKVFLSIGIFCMVALAGCFETIQELTIKEDGSGSIHNTTDMSAGIGMIKQFGGDKASEMDKLSTDTTILLESVIDSIPNLTPEEKSIVRRGSMGMNINMKDEKFIITLNFPFNKLEEIQMLNRLSARVMEESMKNKMGENKMSDSMNMTDGPRASSVDDYFDINYANGLVSKKLNKEKYSSADNDEYLKGMQKMGETGAPMLSTFIINLPRPAKKVTGKNAEVSADKKKITIKNTIDDFFEEPSKIEFRIEY